MYRKEASLFVSLIFSMWLAHYFASLPWTFPFLFRKWLISCPTQTTCTLYDSMKWARAKKASSTKKLHTKWPTCSVAVMASSWHGEYVRPGECEETVESVPSSDSLPPHSSCLMVVVTIICSLASENKIMVLKGVEMCQQPWAFLFLCQILSHYVSYSRSKTLVYGKKPGF